jgi:hypothetical protein
VNTLLDLAKARRGKLRALARSSIRKGGPSLRVTLKTRNGDLNWRHLQFLETRGRQRGDRGGDTDVNGRAPIHLSASAEHWELMLMSGLSFCTGRSAALATLPHARDANRRPHRRNNRDGTHATAHRGRPQRDFLRVWMRRRYSSGIDPLRVASTPVRRDDFRCARITIFALVWPEPQLKRWTY